MDARVEKILSLPAYQRILIVLLLMAVIGAGFFFLVYQGQLEEYESLTSRRDAAQAQLVKNKKIADKLEIYTAEYAKLQSSLNEALGQLPLKQEIPSLLTKIGALAKESGLDVIRFKPGNEVPQGFYAEVPVELNLSGSYHQTAIFFDAVSKMERIVNIQDLRLGNAKSVDGRTTLAVDCRAITFRFIDEPSGQTAKGGQRK